jgi:hypothetical protein
MPPAPRKETDLQPLLESTREDIAGLRRALESLTAAAPAVHDSEGFVVGHSMYVDDRSIRWGDLIAVAAPPPFPPGTYRCMSAPEGRQRFFLRSEIGGMSDPQYVPKPWRLLWRDPREWALLEKADEPRPKRRRKTGDDEDD